MSQVRKSKTLFMTSLLAFAPLYRCLEEFIMGTETRRPLAWEVLSRRNTKVRSGAAEETERLSKEVQDRKFGSSERMWWVNH